MLMRFTSALLVFIDQFDEELVEHYVILDRAHELHEHSNSCQRQRKVSEVQVFRGVKSDIQQDQRNHP